LVRAAIRMMLSFVAAALAAATLASAAFAHADLLRSSPRDGQALERSPRAVVLTFNEGIEAAFVRLRVQDAGGGRVDTGEPYHPQDRDELLAVRLQPRLDGRYFASYRVISADGHPVTRRIAFTVRPPAPTDDQTRERDEAAMPPPADEQGAMMPPPAGEGAPAHEDSESGAITSGAFATARGLGYLAMALAVGAIVFLLAIWLPALARTAGAGAEWARLSERFARRARAIALGAALLGIVATALAIVLEGATAAGISFWAALDPDIINVVSETRVVQAWSARIAIWLVLVALVLVILRPSQMPVLRRAALGADGTARGAGPARAQSLVLFAAIVALALTAPLAGHPASHSPRGLVVASDTLHVLCMCTWLGGLVMLALALPLGMRTLLPEQPTPMLATVVGRFSRMAMIAVTLLLLSGIVNAVVLVASFDALVDTAYGRLVLAKIALFGALITLGALNQRRMLPQLRALAARGDPPGRAATVLRRSVALEIAFALVVLAVTSVLVATEPAATG
jgi:copper transport protein